MTAAVKVLRWRSSDGTGLEACTIRAEGEDLLAEGLVIAPDAEGYALRYAIRFDAAWHTQSVSVALLGSETSLLLTCDQDGLWRKDGLPMPELNYALAPDISATPLTNTFAIRRLNLDQGESSEIQAAYVDLPSGKVFADPQRYTCLEKDALYRFESLDRDFTRDIAVDADGFVVEYPNLFRRVS